MPRVAVRLVGLALVATVLAPGEVARADKACGARGWPWIRLGDVSLPPPFFDSAFLGRLVAQLGAGLEARHIEICAQPGAAGPAASVLALSATGADTISVNVRDAITDKVLTREIGLGGVPPDARPLAVAIAVDELLRASWVELTLPDAPTRSRPVAPEIDALAHAAATRPIGPPRAWDAGVAVAVDRFGGGTRAAGIDLVLRAAPAPPFWVHAALELRKAGNVQAIDGVVRATLLGAELGAAVALPPVGRRWGLALGASGRLLSASLSGEPRTGAHGSEAVATALYLCADLRGDVRLGTSFGLSLAAAVGVPLRGVDILDGTTPVAGLSGPLLSLALGATWRRP